MNNKDLQIRIEELERIISNSKIQQISYPLDDISIKIISDKISGSVATSSKGATSENQAVNESGSGSYSVLKAPDGFLQIRISGTLYYIPIFT